MRLKRLELFGFKSFADRRTLDFQHGLTGIVGPNGCGKSNVVDAVRWVLGERRPTSMRGAEMTDVIFKGSSSRPAMSVAEVTLVLDNDSGALEGFGSEVSVSRRVFKSGEGEYLIDGQKVRLKDLRDMLFDTGLGSRGYAILEQGKIDAVLSADALERRSIFEEAAGISRFRQRKKEAESRLKSVAADMTRLEDVVRELERRQRSLKIQAGKAERFVAAREEWQLEAKCYARHRFDELTRELKSITFRLEELEARAAELRALREAAEGDTLAREREQLALTAELERLVASASEVAGDLRALDERKNQLAARIHSWNESATSESSRAKALGERQVQREAELAEARGRLDELNMAVAHANTTMAAGGASAKEALERFREARAEFAAQNELVLELLHIKNEAQNSRRHLEGSLEPLATRATRGGKRLKDARSNLASAVEKLAADRAELEVVRVEAAAAQARQADLEARLDHAREVKTGAEQNTQTLELNQAGLSSRVDSLRDWEAERAGLEDGTRALFEKREELGLTEALLGIVADHFVCEPEHAAALGAVLGPWAEAVVLSDPSRAPELFAWLREGEIGRARLATPPSNLVQQGGETAALVDSHAGVIGRLVDVVEAREGFTLLLAELVGESLLVESLEHARAIVDKHPGVHCVTMAGELCTAAGMFGGARGAESFGAVARRSQAAAIEAELVEVKVQCETARTVANEAGEKVAHLVMGLSAARDESHGTAGRAQALEGVIQATGRRVRDLEDAATVLEHESIGLTEERVRVEQGLAELASSMEGILARFELENERLEQLERRRRELEGVREEASRNESLARVDWTRLSGEQAGEQRRLEHLCASLEETRRELERTSGLINASERSSIEGNAELEQLGTERADKLALRGDLDEKLSGLRERDKEGREAVEILRHRADTVTRELEGLMDATAKRQLERQRIELAREELLRRSEEELGLDYEGLTVDFESHEELGVEGALVELAGRVSELKRSLDRLGQVNLEAVTELEEVTERLEFLVAQRKDLAESRAALVAAIAKIDVESERLFLEAFQEIRTNFQGIFRKLFGGGKADIILDPDVPPLEAGIEIYARPPGRENLPIGLLSGGQRTMIALALLFGVFQARPSPFCMLDEVDAALDDANIERFLTMLDLFRGMSQFIVVTHNKGTMTACDSLYGITMQPRGISRHVVMQLADVDEFVPDAQGGKQMASTHAAAGEQDEETGEPIRELEPAAPGDALASGAPTSVEEAGAALSGGVTTPEGVVASPIPPDLA